MIVMLVFPLQMVLATGSSDRWYVCSSCYEQAGKNKATLSTMLKNKVSGKRHCFWNGSINVHQGCGTCKRTADHTP